MDTRECINNVIELLNSDRTDSRTGEEICHNIDLAYNTMGSFSRISDEIYGKLTENGKKRFQTIYFLSCIELGYEWIFHGFKESDLRKEASAKFSYNNLAEFENFFFANTGIRLNVSALRSDEIKEGFTSYLRNAIFDSEGAEGREKYAWLMTYVQKYVNMHSTIKQSYIGGVVKGVIFVISPDCGLVGNTEDKKDFIFPYI